MVSQEGKDISIETWKDKVRNPFGMSGPCGFCDEYWRIVKRRCYNEKGELCELCDGAGECAIVYKKWLCHARNQNIRWMEYWARKLLDRIKAVVVR